MRILKLLLILGLVSGPAYAAPRGDHGPDWKRKPNLAEILSVWPAEAFKRGIGGKVTLTCTVTPVGVLTACRVTDEQPPGLGFSQAALLLTPHFVMSPAVKNGVPVESKVNIPVNFGPFGGDSLGSRVPDHLPQAASLPNGLIWMRAPTAADVRAVSSLDPDTRTAGHVVFLCAVDSDGTLGRCDLTVEEPSRQGLALAGKVLLPKFRMRIEGVDPNLRKTLRISVPIHFPNTPVDPDRVLEKPDWTKKIDPAQVQALFPAKAADAGLKSGRAVIECRVGAGGGLTACAASSEDPAGMDFGPNAVRIASALAVNIWTDTGEPAEGAKVRFAIRFVKAED